MPEIANRPRARRVWWLLVAALLLAATLLWFLVVDRRPPAAPPSAGFSAWNSPVPVRVVPVVAEDLVVRFKAIGNVSPWNSVAVRPRVDGQLARVLFDEGQRVQAGQLLAEIDPAPFQVQLAQAEGQQQQNLAQLNVAEDELATYETLFRQDSIARQQLDRQRALVRQLRGTLKADQAQVDNARLQLSYTRILAPISGRAGLRRVDAGNLVSSGDTAGIVTITQTQPAAVVFSLPEAQLAALREAQRRGQPLQVEAWDRGELQPLAQGRLATLDNQIDTATGTLRLKARFDNGDDVLFPNQFVNVRLQLGRLPGALVIPGDAVQYGSAGTYVYVVDAGSKARVRPVVLGPADGGRVAVSQGLAVGDKVVLEGLDRLREGREVVLAPQAEAAASPLAARPASAGAR